MKKKISKVIALILALVLAIPAYTIPVNAATWEKVSATNYASRYTSSYYTYGKFYENMTKIPLTGDGARDVVAVAASQMGYLEGDSSAGQDGVTGGSSNMTEYGAYTNVNGAAWCASFCSWCMYTAEVTDTRGTETYMARNGYYWSECYVPYWSNMLYDNGLYRFSDYYRSSYDSSQASYTPQPGDLVFFTAGYEPLDEGHIGLVAFSDGTYVYTLEGNTSSQDGVESEGGGAFFKKYSLSSSSIAGYGILPYETKSLPVIDYTGENPTTGLYVTVAGAVGVYYDIDDSTASWTLPMSSVFEVTDIQDDSNGVTMLYSTCEIDGTTVKGWIPLGNTSTGFPRTFQIYTTYEDPNDQNYDGIPDSYNPTTDSEGNYTFENAYGYEFDIDDVDGTIDGEDATIITSSTAYESCNPNWAVSVQLRPTGNANEYTVVTTSVNPGSASAAGITFEDGDIVMVVHSAASQPGQGYGNWMDRVAAATLKTGDVVTVASDYSTVTIPSVENPDDTGDSGNTGDSGTTEGPDLSKIDEAILYQTRNDSDVRLIAYVDALEKYSSVSFNLTMDGNTSKDLVCTTAYSGLYANDVLHSTYDIYNAEGYLVTYILNGYMALYAGKEVTVTVTYTMEEGGTYSTSRTITIGTLPEDTTTPSEPIETGSLTYANALEWGDDGSVGTGHIYSFASTDSTATPLSILAQSDGFFGWWYGVVLEYDSTAGTWEVVASDLNPNGSNTVEAATLGDNRIVIIFHSGAATDNAESYNFFKEHGTVGTKLYLSGTLTAIQGTAGALSGVSFANGVEEEETPVGDVPDYGGAIAGAGLQGSVDNLYYGCDLSFYNVSDNNYANGYSDTDSGADYSLVDFAKMKADGCDFVILRFGSEDSSGYYCDPHFVTYYNMARAAGMDIGLYYYSYALTYAEAAAEAQYVIDTVESYGMYFEYPLYIDIEESDQLALGEAALSNVCYGWCETMADQGYFPGIYGNYTLYDGVSSQIQADYDFWIAYVSSSTSTSSYNPSNTNISDECGMWQYSFYGYEYDGIGLDMLDVNVAYKDYPAIMEAGGYNNM